MHTYIDTRMFVCMYMNVYIHTHTRIYISACLHNKHFLYASWVFECVFSRGRLYMHMQVLLHVSYVNIMQIQKQTHSVYIQIFIHV